MKITCAPDTFDFEKLDSDLNVVLFSQAPNENFGCLGEAITKIVKRRKLAPSARAWDFLSIALSCFAADLAGHRKISPDGWTRQFDVTVSVTDKVFWESVRTEIQSALQFLTTDIWTLRFVDGGYFPKPPKGASKQTGTCVALLSGGLDSLIGAIDLSSDGEVPVTVSHISRGDKSRQETFPKMIGDGLPSLQMSHGAKVPNGETPASQRSRSIVFIAYAVLVSTCLDGGSDGKSDRCYVSENGFISLNPPLTPMRVGSLSTRTTHPTYFRYLQHIFDKAGFDLEIQNNYSLMTKGEMLANCQDQQLIKKIAHESTSCGRFLHYNYKHCGRCVPCIVRRAAFLKWGVADQTEYIFDDLGKNDENHSGFDDVRAAAIACLEESEIGINRWAGATLASAGLADTRQHMLMLERGIGEIRSLLSNYGVI